MPALVVEVALQSSLVQQLPLLNDVQSSTPGSEGKPASADLPCTVWGLVSLLILLGGGVDVDEWFGGDPSLQDPSLPANTLLNQPSDRTRRKEPVLLVAGVHVVAAVQAASFMGCNGIVSQLTDFFQDLVQTVVERGRPFANRRSHHMKVLRCVPPENEHAVFAGSVADSKIAVNLPASLLSKWIASSVGEIDLRGVTLSTKQWVELAVAICQAPSGAVKSLHVGMMQASPEVHSLAVSTVQAIVAHSSHLHSLGLYGLNIGAKQLPALQHLFSECPDSLAKLQLYRCERGKYAWLEKFSFLAAVAQVHGLRELHMRDWVSFVECHTEACHPLRSIPGLKIFVPKYFLENVGSKGCFPPGLDFHGFE